MTESLKNANVLQDVIGDNLFPHVEHISDVKQVLELQAKNGQNLRQAQIRALLLLEQLGSNKFLHGDKDPYKSIRKDITDSFKSAVVAPTYYLATIEELIPKPPKNIVVTPNGRVIESKREV